VCRFGGRKCSAKIACKDGCGREGGNVEQDLWASTVGKTEDASRDGLWSALSRLHQPAYPSARHHVNSDPQEPFWG
jgi:hypothetical protein